MVVDPDESKAVEGVPRYSHYEFMAADPNWDLVDFVVIASPNHVHLEQAMWAVRKGKRVLCEKPLTFNVEAAFRAQGVESIVNVMQLRHHPCYAELTAIDPSGLRSLNVHVKVKRDESYWKGWKGDPTRSGGLLFNLGVHYIDVIHTMLGLAAFRGAKVKRSARHVYSAELEFNGIGCPVGLHVEVTGRDAGVDRYVEANGKRYRFSSRENLSMEGLHLNVYRDFLEGRGPRVRDVIGTLRLTNELMRYA